MIGAETLPVPTSGNTVPAMAMVVRRILLLDRASQAIGGGAKLGAVLGISRRAVNYKLVSDRPVTDDELDLAADAVEARAHELLRLVADLRGLTAKPTPAEREPEISKHIGGMQ